MSVISPWSDNLILFIWWKMSTKHQVQINNHTVSHPSKRDVFWESSSASILNKHRTAFSQPSDTYDYLHRRRHPTANSITIPAIRTSSPGTSTHSIVGRCWGCQGRQDSHRRWMEQHLTRLEKRKSKISFNREFPAWSACMNCMYSSLAATEGPPLPPCWEQIQQ